MMQLFSRERKQNYKRETKSVATNYIQVCPENNVIAQKLHDILYKKCAKALKAHFSFHFILSIL